MSCLSPININTNQEVNECVLKCDLVFSYSIAEPMVTMTNYSTYLSYVLSNPSVNVAKLADETYNLQEIQIYSPSVHQYNNSYAIGEMMLIHNNINSSTTQLIISIPIGQTGAATNNIGFNNLMNLSIQNIPTYSSGTKNILIPSLNLNTFVGQTPYYFYTGSLLTNCTQQTYYILFDPTNFGMFINSDQLTNNVISILSSADYPIQDNSGYVMNKKGPNANGLGEGEYMSCVLVDTSEETTETASYSNNSGMNMNTIGKYLALFGIIGITFLITYFIMIKVYGSIAPLVGVEAPKDMTSDIFDSTKKYMKDNIHMPKMKFPSLKKT